MDPRALARYPFLGEASQYVKGLGVTLGQLLADRAYGPVRQAAMRRVQDALTEGAIRPSPMVSEGEALTELLAYPAARMIASCVPDNYLLRRFAVAEAALARQYLEPEGEGVLRHMAEEFDLDLRGEGEHRLHFTDFLRQTRAFRDKKWKLVNQRVDHGYVVLKRDDLLRILQSALQLRLMDELPLPVNDAIVATFKDEVRVLQTQLALRRERFKPEEVATVNAANFPPCITRLLAAVRASENVPHMGRFALVAFLHNIGVPNEEIFRIFSNVPDFAQDVTRYQIEHITGQISGTEYTAPECSTMKSYGICPGPDQLCLTITHPLNYYRKKTWRQRRGYAERPEAQRPVAPTPPAKPAGSASG